MKMQHDEPAPKAKIISTDEALALVEQDRKKHHEREAAYRRKEEEDERLSDLIRNDIQRLCDKIDIVYKRNSRHEDNEWFLRTDRVREWLSKL